MLVFNGKMWFYHDFFVRLLRTGLITKAGINVLQSAGLQVWQKNIIHEILVTKAAVNNKGTCNTFT